MENSSNRDTTLETRKSLAVKVQIYFYILHDIFHAYSMILIFNLVFAYY